jgi:hypothetical protein
LNDSTLTDSKPSSASQKFTLFGKLPTEIRLKIWGFATPDPCVVVQRESHTSKYCFTFNRPVPAVLHACKESRSEFLEPDDPSTDVSLASRRREHPVYKLCFRAERLRTCPVFFSADVDTFWGMDYKARDTGPYRVQPFWKSQCLGITCLVVASNLKHLATTLHDLPNIDSEFFNSWLPKLETLTILLSEKQWARRTDLVGHPWDWIDCQFSPEVDGELSLKYSSEVYKAYIENIKSQIRHALKRGNEDPPESSRPIIKFRFRKQFVENEGLTLIAPQQHWHFPTT